MKNHLLNLSSFYDSFCCYFKDYYGAKSTEAQLEFTASIEVSTQGPLNP